MERKKIAEKMGKMWAVRVHLGSAYCHLIAEFPLVNCGLAFGARLSHFSNICGCTGSGFNAGIGKDNGVYTVQQHHKWEQDVTELAGCDVRGPSG